MKTDRQVLVVGSDPELLQAVSAAARLLRNVPVEIARGGHLASQAAKAAQAAAVIVEVDLDEAGALERFQQFVWSARGAPVIAVARIAAGEEVRKLFRAGAADVLTCPYEAEALRASLAEQLKTAADEALAGGIISIVKGCGGAGATTLAANLAGALATGEVKRGRAPRRTALLDLDLQFGDADVALDLTPRTTLFDVLRAADRVDPRFIEGVMTEHASGLKLLAAPATMVPLEAINSEFALELVEHVSAGFERTIVDLPGAWTDWTLSILRRSDLVVVVTAPTVAGALGARRVLDALKEAGVERAPTLVLNRLAGLLTSLERPGRIGKTLDVAVDAALALDPACAKAAERGQLVVEAAPNARLAKELKALAARLDERVEALSAAPALSEAAA